MTSPRALRRELLELIRSRARDLVEREFTAALGLDQPRRRRSLHVHESPRGVRSVVGERRQRPARAGEHTEKATPRVRGPQAAPSVRPSVVLEGSR